jgi:NADP-dependent 3-hydroxy acid dehydrogenase YdfG
MKQTVVVTGGTGGIGAGVAEVLNTAAITSSQGPCRRMKLTDFQGPPKLILA